MRCSCCNQPLDLKSVVPDHPEELEEFDWSNPYNFYCNICIYMSEHSDIEVPTSRRAARAKHGYMEPCGDSDEY